MDTSATATTYDELYANARQASAQCQTMPSAFKFVCNLAMRSLVGSYCKVNSNALFLEVKGSANADAKLIDKRVQVAGMRVWARVDAVSPQVGMGLPPNLRERSADASGSWKGVQGACRLGPENRVSR